MSDRALRPSASEPRFAHDCESCVFLGGCVAGGRLADLYVHPGGVMPTVIARYSSEGSDYASGLTFSFGLIAELTLARLLAEQGGHLKETSRG